MKVEQILSSDFFKSSSPKQKNFQTKTLGFNEILFYSVSQNTKIFTDLIKYQFSGRGALLQKG